MDNNINQTIIEKVAIKSVAIYKAITMLPPPEIKDLWAENNYTKQTQNDLKLDAKDNCATMKKTKTKSTPVDWQDITKRKNQKIKKVLISCDICNQLFERAEKEIKRNIKKQTTIVCTNKNCRSTLGKLSVKKRINPGGSDEWMKQIAPKADELSPFRALLRKTRSRKSKKVGSEVSITVIQLKELWEKQNGICAITGLKMVLPKTTAETNVGPKCASIDRIDNSKGYIIDNIQLVCYSANLARNSFDIQIIKRFFEEIGGPCVT